MTAPLTPRGHHSPGPPPSSSEGPEGAAGAERADHADGGRGAQGAHAAGEATPAAWAGTFLPELRRGALTAAAVAVLGVAFGLLWLWLAPRIPLISDGRAVYLKDTEGEQAAGGDGTFVLLGLGFGVLVAAGAFWRCRAGGVGLVVGLAAGALIGSVIGWRIGVWLGPPKDLVAHAKAVGPGKVFYAPLDLRAKAALLAWPIAATLAHLLLTSAFGPRDPEPDGPPPRGGEVAPGPEQAGRSPRPPLGTGERPGRRDRPWPPVD